MDDDWFFKFLKVLSALSLSFMLFMAMWMFGLGIYVFWVGMAYGL